MSFSEHEFKYKADGIKLSDFVKLMETLPVKSFIEVSSPDVYYTKGESEFLRFRNDTKKPELTKKVKIKETNNWVRVEVDLPLDPKRLDEKVVKRFAQLFSYEQNFKIHKICYIYFLENVNYVYYAVLDEELKEAGRFIEVEVNKDRVSDLTALEGGVEGILTQAADVLKALGLTPQNRMKKSLFELFLRKEIK